MLGEKILSWKLSWNKRFDSIKRQSIPYNKVKRIGIIIKNDQSKYNAQIDSLYKSLINDGKHVEVLCYQREIINSKYNMPFFSFSKKELKWNGEVENDHFKKVIETKYDYLISISDEMDVILDYLMCKSPSLLRIANSDVHNNTNADFLIQNKNQENIGETADQFAIYLKKLS